MLLKTYDSVQHSTSQTNHVTDQQHYVTYSIPLSTSTELQSSDSLAVLVSDSHAEH